jgi:hypothetical protein
MADSGRGALRYPRAMLIQPVDYFLVVWFTLGAASTGYVAWDHDRTDNGEEDLRS